MIQSFDFKHTVKLAFRHSIILMFHLFQSQCMYQIQHSVSRGSEMWVLVRVGVVGPSPTVCLFVSLFSSFSLSVFRLLSANRSAPLTNRQITIVVSLLAPPPPDAILYPNVIWGLSPGVGTLSPGIVIVLYPLFTLQIRPLHFSTLVIKISVNFQ